MGPSRSSSLRIGDDSSTVVGSRRVRDAPGRSAAVEPRNAPGAPPLPFAERYRPPPGVRIWTPDVLTFYAASVPGMVCFF